MSVWPRFGSGTIDPFVRRRIEDEIERLIMVLDAIDGDPDFEEEREGDWSDWENVDLVMRGATI